MAEMKYWKGLDEREVDSIPLQSDEFAERLPVVGELEKMEKSAASTKNGMA